MSRLLNRLSRLAIRRPWVVIGVWLIVAIGVASLSSGFGRELKDDVTVPGLDSTQAVKMLERFGSADAGATAQVALAPDLAGVTFDDPSARTELAAVAARLSSLPNVVAVSDPTTAISPDGRVALAQVQYLPVDRLEPADLDRLKKTVREASANGPLKVEADGDLFFTFEQPSSSFGELIGLLVAIAVLLAAFGSVVAAGVPIGTAVIGLAIGLSSLSLVTYLIDIPKAAVGMAAMVGLGTGIDYALFVVTRHREHLAAGLSVGESIVRATTTAGRAVVVAGGTVVVSIMGLAVAGLPFLTAVGVSIALVVLVSVAAAITLLPAILAVLGHRIDRLRVHRRSAQGDTTQRRWNRWGHHVTRHPIPYAVGGVAVLLAMAAPTLALRLGVPDSGTLPQSRTERRAYDLVSGAFGAGSNGPLLIAVDISRDTTIVEPLLAAIRADRGIIAVQPPALDAKAGVAAIVAIPSTAPQDEATRATIERLRATVFPNLLATHDAEIHIGGQTATFSDLSNRVQQRLPWFVLAVVVVSFILLTVVFRSLLVPLKAALLNLLSIGASYGVLVMVFQWEWAGSLIGLEGPVPIISFIPMLMFAIVFGLSMDYEVFLLSRIREHHQLTGDNKASIVQGLSSTARVITSAALIMVSVFLGFVTAGDPITKMLGLGLATAIFVDATIVRMVLVPATMTLMGNANWWLPRRLDRALPHISLEPAEQRPATFTGR